MAIKDMVQDKIELSRQFEKLCDEFKREFINGSIQLHFSQGVVAKIHATKVY